MTWQELITQVTEPQSLEQARKDLRAIRLGETVPLNGRVVAVKYGRNHYGLFNALDGGKLILTGDADRILAEAYRS